MLLLSLFVKTKVTRRQKKQHLLLSLFEGRSSQLYTQLMQLRKESLKKKIQASMGFEPLISAILVQHCTGIAEVKGSNSVQAWMFFIYSKFHLPLSQDISHFKHFIKKLKTEIWIYITDTISQYGCLFFGQKKDRTWGSGGNRPYFFY